MGLLTGNLALKRYRIYQPLSETFRDDILGSVSKFAFQENLKSRSKEPNYGWISIQNPDDIDFNLNKVLFERYFAISLRQDKKAINSKLFQILLDRKTNDVLIERGIDRIGKKHKDDLKEALEEELLAQTLPAVTIFDFVWDTSNGDVFIFASSELVQDIFQGLFFDSFGIRLYAERLVDWLIPKWSWDEVIEALDNYVEGGASERSNELTSDGWHKGNPFRGREILLGSDFLTWLWYESEKSDGFFELDAYKSRSSDSSKSQTNQRAITNRTLNDEITNIDLLNKNIESSIFNIESKSEESLLGENGNRENITLWLDNKLIFSDISEIEIPEITTMTGEAPSTTPEAKLSIASGKRPIEARLAFKRFDAEWYFTLKVTPSGLEINQIKLPIEVKNGDEEKIYERMYLLDLLYGTVRNLFQIFFEKRTSDFWKETIIDWIGERQ